ncbi:MAG: cell envelope integrity protein TolA [Pseudomonadota bacterium]
MQSLRDNAGPLAISIVGHVLLVALLLFGVRASGNAQPIAGNIIEATVVGTMAVPDQPLPEPIPAPDEIDANAEQARLEEEQRAQAERNERERLAAEEQARQRAEVERLANEEAERKAQEAAAKRAAEEAAKKAQAEAARLAEQKRREEEQRRAAELERERKAAAERARKAQEARRQAEAEDALKAMLAAEEARNSAVDAGLQAAYIAAIKQDIQRSWTPPAISGEIRCEVLVRQARSGTVISVDQVDCGGNAPLERSLEAAVFKADPLPRPDDPNLFDPNLRILFESKDL